MLSLLYHRNVLNFADSDVAVGNLVANQVARTEVIDIDIGALGDAQKRLQGHDREFWLANALNPPFDIARLDTFIPSCDYEDVPDPAGSRPRGVGIVTS
jgi:hypothetical protein